MTQAVDDKDLGKIARQQNDLFRRIREGSLNVAIVSAQLQEAIQGNFTLAQIPVWVVLGKRCTGGCFEIDREIRNKTRYDCSLVDTLVGISSQWWNTSLIRLRSSDLKAKGKNALFVCEQALKLGLHLCHPETYLHLCLQYDMKKGERFVMPLYGFSSTSEAPRTCAEFRYKLVGKKFHTVTTIKPELCGVDDDLEWVFQLEKR